MSRMSRLAMHRASRSRYCHFQQGGDGETLLACCRSASEESRSKGADRRADKRLARADWRGSRDASAWPSRSCIGARTCLEMDACPSPARRLRGTRPLPQAGRGIQVRRLALARSRLAQAGSRLTQAGVVSHNRGVASRKRESSRAAGVVSHERGVDSHYRGVVSHEQGVVSHDRGVAWRKRGVVSRSGSRLAPAVSHLP